MSDSLIGRSVDHYRIVGREDRGDGVVYKAHDIRFDRTVTVTLLPGEADDADLKQRFLREARVAAGIHHRNIPTFYAAGTTDDDRLYIVTEYTKGITLKQRLAADRQLPLTDAINITTQVAEALAVAHAKGLTHGDLKPSNILLTENGGVKVEFAVALALPTIASESRTTNLGKRASFAYKSPEQVRGDAVDARSDIWSVGAILYEMLAGHVPFRGQVPSALVAILHETPASLREQRSDIPDEIEHIVFRALHKDPDLRFEAVGELAQALSTIERRDITDESSARVMARSEVATQAAGDLFASPAADGVLKNLFSGTSDSQGHEWRHRSVYTVVAVAAITIVVTLWRMLSGSSASTASLGILSVARVISIAAVVTFGLRHLIELVVAIQLVAKLRRK